MKTYRTAGEIARAVAASIYDSTGFLPAVELTDGGIGTARVSDGDISIDIETDGRVTDFTRNGDVNGAVRFSGPVDDDAISEVSAAFWEPTGTTDDEPDEPDGSEIRGFDVRIEWTNGDVVRGFRDRSRTGSPSELLATIADEIATDRRNPKNIAVEFLYE